MEQEKATLTLAETEAVLFCLLWEQEGKDETTARNRAALETALELTRQERRKDIIRCAYCGEDARRATAAEFALDHVNKLLGQLHTANSTNEDIKRGLDKLEMDADREPVAVRSEDPARYNAETEARRELEAAKEAADDDNTLQMAAEILQHRAEGQQAGEVFGCPAHVALYLAAQKRDSADQHETLTAIYQDSKLRLITQQDWPGSVNSAPFYVREIARTALESNATSVTLAHNHPSGTLEPSRHDRDSTAKLKQALALIDITLNDHLIYTAAGKFYSFAERGIL